MYLYDSCLNARSCVHMEDHKCSTASLYSSSEERLDFIEHFYF
jgi:hypothetical protein